MSGDLQKMVSYSSDELRSRNSASDWDAAAAMSDAEIEAADSDDSEIEGLDDAWIENAITEQPKRKGVYMNIDEDVLSFFKSQGYGYQLRINDVLRAYVKHQQSS